MGYNKLTTRKFDFDDILIVPSVLSDINSRFTDIDPFDERGMLPIFTAPMLDVIDDVSAEKFINNKIYTVLPRGHGFNPIHSKMYKYLSYSLSEFDNIFLNKNGTYNKPIYILIDIANGHQKRLIKSIKSAKEIHGDNLVLMVGNIANPWTYKELSEAGADYIRLGIGNGSACTTTANGAVGYPMASLIKETYEISCNLKKPAKIIADGGMRKYSDIIKALALGADYVMIGGMFNKMIEASGKTYKNNFLNRKVESKNPTSDLKKGVTLYKKFRGMSTKSVQIELGGVNLKTSEGVEKFNKIRWSLSSWVENLEHYIRTNMSYCNSDSLSNYIGNVDYIEITDAAYKRFNK